jgi:hypothetical protein
MTLDVLVTGTGRSGTVYMAKVLTAAGVPCGHESMFTPEPAAMVKERWQGDAPPRLSQRSQDASTADWVDVGTLRADASYMAVPYLAELPTTISLIHTVRHPLLVISSFVDDMRYFRREPENPYNAEGHEDWIYDYTQGLGNWPDPVNAAAWHYLRWNLDIEEQNKHREYLRVRVGEPLPDALFELLKVPRPEMPYRKRVNSLRKRRGNRALAELDPWLQTQMVTLCDRYGFWLPDCDP